MELNIKNVTPAHIQLVKDLVIDALTQNRREPGYMTRSQVKNAWQWIEWLGGPGKRVGIPPKESDA